MAHFHVHSGPDELLDAGVVQGSLYQLTTPGYGTFTGHWRIVACLNVFDTQAGGIEMKITLMAFVAAGFISSSTFALADTKVSPAEEEKIKATLEGFGCTGGKIEKEDYGYGIDDVKCKDGQEYEFKLDSNFKLIVMTRD
jgi:hypothetical protein